MSGVTTAFAACCTDRGRLQAIQLAQALAATRNHDGAIDFKDHSRIVVLKVGEERLETLKTIDDAVATYDITADARKFTYVGLAKDGMYLKKYDLLTGTETDVLSGAAWISEVSISADDQWCAFYLSKGAIENQVVVAGNGSAQTVSGFVGNGWHLFWAGNTLAYLNNDTHGYDYYDPATGQKPAFAGPGLGTIVNKHLSGWPASTRLLP